MLDCFTNRYSNICKQIFKLVKSYQRYNIQSVDDYEILFGAFCKEAVKLQNENHDFNIKVIRKNHIENPFKAGNMRYVDELLGETWYNFIHVQTSLTLLRTVSSNEEFIRLVDIDYRVVNLFEPSYYGDIVLKFLNKTQVDQPIETLKMYENTPASKKIINYLWQKLCVRNITNDSIPLYIDLLSKYELNGLRDMIIAKLKQVYTCTFDKDMLSSLEIYLKEYDKLSEIEKYCMDLVLQDKVSLNKDEFIDFFFVKKDFNFIKIDNLLDKDNFSELIKHRIIKEIVFYEEIPNFMKSYTDKMDIEFKEVTSDTFKTSVLTTNCQLRKTSNLILPVPIQDTIDKYNQEYKTMYPNRKLTWCHPCSIVHLKFKDTLLVVKFNVFLILYLYNRYNKLSVELIGKETGLPKSEIELLLQYLIIERIVDDTFSLSLDDIKQYPIVLTKNDSKTKHTKKESLLTKKDTNMAKIVKYMKTEKSVQKDTLIKEFGKIDDALKALEIQGYIEIDCFNIVKYIP